LSFQLTYNAEVPFPAAHFAPAPSKVKDAGNEAGANVIESSAVRPNEVVPNDMYKTAIIDNVEMIPATVLRSIFLSPSLLQLN
jgi:hypothetical protein